MADHQRIADRCPHCGAQSLFIGASGWLTCSVIGCKDPSVTSAIDKLRVDALLGRKLREIIKDEQKRLEALGEP